MIERFSASNTMPGLVQGRWWKCRMNNGAVFELWSPWGDMKKSEAKKALLDYANSSCSEDNPAYEPQDVEAVWSARTCGIRGE